MTGPQSKTGPQSEETKLRRAVCPGSFDPVTNGHLDIIARASRLVFVIWNESRSSSPLAGRIFTLHQDTTTIGRMGGNDIVILEGSVSRHHARLSFGKGQWSVQDLGSANGTFVNRARLAANQSMIVPQGSELQLGHVYTTFELVS